MKKIILCKKFVLLFLLLNTSLFSVFQVYAEIEKHDLGERVDGVIGLKEEPKNKAIEFYSKYFGAENTKKIDELVKQYDKGDKEAYKKVEDIVASYNPNEKTYIANYLVIHKSFYPYCLASFENGQFSNIVGSSIVNDVVVDLQEVKAIWDLIRKHVPYHMSKHIKYLNIDIGRPEGSLMSINPIDDICENWQINIDRELVYKNELFVKNLTRIIPAYVFFNSNYIDLTAKENSNSFIFYDNIYKENSPIAEFYRQFWKGKRVLKEPFTNKEAFLTERCKQNCMEDFIETFSYAVLNGHYERRGILWEKTSFLLDENLITKDYIEEVKSLLKLY